MRHPMWVSALLGDVARVVAWGAVAIFLGLIVGLAAVVLPPIGAIGIISLPALVLLWVMPELPAVSDKLVRRLFLAMLIVDLCLPAYYTIDLKGLPWISARRIVTFALIVVFAYAISSSSAAREQIAANLRSAKSISISALGFLIMVILSVFTSVRPPESLSQAFEVMLNWYVPFLAVLYAIRSERDILLLVRVIAVCALFVSGAAVVEFIIHQRIFVNLIPEPLLSSLIEANPVFAIFVNTPAYRLGVWRSVSIYTTPLSLGEFGAMVAPLGLFYLVHGRAFFSRAFGILVLASCLLAVFCSGSRGGYLGFILGSGIFTVLWTVRTLRLDKGSLAPALVAFCGSTGFAVLFALIIFWGRLRHMVLGGGYESYSDQGRIDQVNMALPHILSNPFTGHGIGLGAQVVGFTEPGGLLTLDSYVLTLLVETGLPGLLFFFGMIVFSAWFGVSAYLSNQTRLSALAGCVACSLIAFGAYRFFLNQHDNHTLLFELVGFAVLLSNPRLQQSDITKSAAPRGRL